MQRKKLTATSIACWNIYCHKLKTFGNLLPSCNDMLRPVTFTLQLRPLSDSAMPGKKLTDIKKGSKDNKVKDHYPKLGSRKEEFGHALGDLIRELKGEQDERQSEAPTFKEQVKRKALPKRKSRQYIHKADPFQRVSALSKHVDIASLIHRKESLRSRKQKLEIVPDDTEIGELLKSLTRGEFTEDMVKDVMSNIRPRSQNERDESRMTYMKDEREEGLLKTRFSDSKSRIMDGPRSHYLDSLFKLDEVGKQDSFVSIHNIKWKQTVRNSVPKLGPTNAFEMMMLEADKMWSFPIDNEVGLDSEDPATFEEHIFLGEHLGMFPKEGQIRRFMELVIIGLQQNPYYSVPEKIDKINWFKKYFENFSDEDIES